MKINCLACGHKVELDDAYDDFEGQVKCLCRTMLEIRTEDGKLKNIRRGGAVSPGFQTQPAGAAGRPLTGWALRGRLRDQR
jgi:hypothetical protein